MNTETDAKAAKKELNALRKRARNLIADYMRAEGCGCCANDIAQNEAEVKLAKLLKVPKYPDGSGYNFGKFESKGGD